MEVATPAAHLLILPGLYDSGPDHWQSHMERALGPQQAVRVRQRDWAAPVCAEWVQTLDAAIRASDTPVVLVAHSTACLLVAHWTQTAALPQLLRVRGALLVAPSDPLGPSYPAGPTGFAPVPTAPLPFPSVVVASRTDAYVAFDTAAAWAAAWGSRLVDLGDAGHINADAGFGPWPEGLAIAQQLGAAPTARLARRDDIPALNALIDASVRALSTSVYTPQQIESALRHMFGVDTQLVDDGTYFVLEADGHPVACGGWSGRQTLFGGDQHKSGEDTPVDPSVMPARIRAFFVHPSYARRGLGQRLYALAAHEARRAGFTRVELMATLPGVPLYTALGFVACEDVGVQLGDGVTVPCLRMDRPL
jgi:predicted alpha/beta hydrolase family esterase/GNAT superfamily N-acetyltransferase